MPTQNRRPATSGKRTPREVAADVRSALDWLEAKSTDRDRANLVRFGINARRAYGVSMANIQVLAKNLGRNHVLASALWATGRYEARMLAAFVDEPALVTPAQMDRWCRDFDNWGICDTVCFKLFDRSPHAWPKVTAWSRKTDEFGKRAAFALLASLAGHDKTSGDQPFLDGLRLIERAASDERNFVKKGVNWALRRIGTRNAALRTAAIEVAGRLAASPDPAARWVGSDALRELTRGRPKPTSGRRASSTAARTRAGGAR
jgi:3-methyladenine DNA glycosylase AlkD